VPFDTILDMKPYLAPGPPSALRMELIGIITHQGTKEQGHYVAITRKGHKWFSYNDAIVTRVTVTELLQTQAYILIYRRKDQDGGTATHGPRNSTMIQNSTIKKPKLSHKMEYRPLKSLTPGPRGKLPEQNIPCQQRSSGGDIPQPGLIYGEGLLKENLVILDTLPTSRPDPQVPANGGEGEEGGSELPVGDPTFDLANLPPLDAGEPGQTECVRRYQLEHVNTGFPQIILTLQNLGSKEEDEVVGAEEPGGDPTLKLILADQEKGHPENDKIPEQNISCQQKPIGRDTLQLSPVHGNDLLKTNPMILDILPTNCSDPQALTARGKGEREETEEPGGD